jgi:hypothetical protein
MISMHQSSGTYLYPLLGKGYEQSVYGNSASVRFEGPKGSVTLELPLVTFWQLTEVFHDRSVRTDE